MRVPASHPKCTAIKPRMILLCMSMERRITLDDSSSHRLVLPWMSVSTHNQGPVSLNSPHVWG